MISLRDALFDDLYREPTGHAYRFSLTDACAIPIDPNAHGAILLEVQRKQWKPSALLSYTTLDDALVAIQIQGAHGAYSELYRIHWERALLRTLKEHAQSQQSPLVGCVSSIRLIGMDRADDERLPNRYDLPARAEGFVYDPEREIYVKRI